MKTTYVLPLLLLSMLAACGKGGGSGAPAAPPAPEVGVITLAPQSVQLSSELPGRTAAYRMAEVRPQVEGIVKRRLFTEGAEVRAGQPLYEIDPAPYQAALQRAEATLASGEAQFKAARLRAERYGPLQERGVVSKQDYDDALAEQQAGAAAIDGAKAAVQTARIDLTYTQVRAPISGRIGRSLVTEGALVKAAQDAPIAVVSQLDPIYVDVTQSSTELLKLRRDLAAGLLQSDAKEQAKVTLLLEDGSRYPQQGTLKFSEVTVDQGTGSVLLRAEFPNPDRNLLPGMFVRATLGMGSSSEALLVPQAAVTRNARGEATVLVVDADNKVSERIIEVGRSIGSDWMVSSGLKAGERVVVEGLQKIRPGATVNAQPAAAGK